MVIHGHYFMISSLLWHSSNKFDFAHLTNSEIRGHSWTFVLKNHPQRNHFAFHPQSN